jgi:ADP-ribose pyrophosphatase YjhB (NUDIX family)
VLLVREACTGGWTFPGGWADVGDTPGGVAERETREESGYEVKARKLLAVFDKSRHEHPPSLFYTYKMLVLCDLVGGEARESHETDGVGFFRREAVPSLDLERTAPSQVACAFDHHADPSRPADFD